MRLNIKNARRLETTLNEQMVRLSSRVRNLDSKGGFSSSEEAGEFFKNSLNSTLKKLSEMRSIKFSIRESIGKFNKDSGIDDTTIKIAEYSSLLEVLEDIPVVSPPYLKTDYSGKSLGFTSGLDEEAKEEFYVETLKLKRKIVRLKDKCQGINSTGTIELSDEVEVFLKVNGLID